MGLVLRIAQQQHLMEPVTQTGHLSDGVLALGHEQIEERGLVFRRDLGECGGFPQHQAGDRVGVQRVGLAWPAGAASPCGRPAGIAWPCGRTAGIAPPDVSARGDQVLGQSAAILPGALDPPLPCSAEAGRPLLHLAPSAGRVGAPPLPPFAAGAVQRHRCVYLLVCVSPDRDHRRRLPPQVWVGTAPGATGLVWW